MESKDEKKMLHQLKYELRYLLSMVKVLHKHAIIINLAEFFFKNNVNINDLVKHKSLSQLRENFRRYFCINIVFAG
jgi:hypothetical protein